MFDSDIVDMCVFVCLSTICLSECLYFVFCLSFCSNVCLSVCFLICLCDILAYLHTLVFIVHLLLWIYFYGKHASILMNDHTLHGECLCDCLCYRRAVAVSSCRPACLHVSFCLCLQVCMCHRLSIFCLPSVLSAVYFSVCPDDIH